MSDGRAQGMMSVEQRNFFWMLTGRSFSRLGDTFTFLALTLMIYDRTDSVMNVGTFLIITNLPAILLGPFIGVWVDRLNKRRVALFGELLRAAAVFSIPFLPNISYIYVLTFLSAMIGFVSKNAQTSMIPELFPREQLMSYNAKIASTVEIMGVVGPVLAGMLIGFWEYTPAFLLDGTTFLYSAFTLTMLNMANVTSKNNGESAARTSFFAEMAAGAKYLIGMPRVMNALMIMFTTMIVSGVFNVLLVAFSKDVVGVSDTEYGWIEAGLGAGFAIGAMLMNYGRSIDPLKWVRLSALIDGLFFLLLGFTNSFWTELLVIIGVGIASVIAMVAAPTMMQMEAQSEYIGRVIGFYQTVFMLGSVISMGLAGVVSSMFDMRGILQYGGGGIIVAAVLFSLKRLPRTDVQDTESAHASF